MASLRFVAAVVLHGALTAALGAPLGAQLLPARQYPVASSVVALTSGDLNGDGRDDVVTGGNSLGLVSVLLGDPAGGFLPATHYAMDGNANDVALGYVNGDALLDVVSCNVFSASISVRLGDGAGGFGPLHVHAGVSSPNSLTLADFDGDGDDDVAATQLGPRRVAILLSDGTGELALAGTYQLDADPHAIAHADFDGNGTADLAVMTHGSWSAWLGDGAGGFALTFTEQVPGQGNLVVTGDVDEQGDADVLTESVGGVFLHLGNGDGTFAPAQLVSSSLGAAVLADADGNGYDDLIGVGGQGIEVLLGGAGPGFAAALPDVPLDSTFRDLAVLEVDGDGLPDLVAGSSQTSGVVVLPGAGFGVLDSYSPMHVDVDPSEYTLADLDGDHDVDAAIASLGAFGGDGGVTVLLNDGAGTLVPTPTVRSMNLVDIASGDIDADGDVDLVSMSQNVGLRIQLGDGSGAFPPPFSIDLRDSPLEMTLGDLNGDGADDAVVSQSFDPTGGFSVLLADGVGGFTAPVSHTIGVTPIAPTIADLDLDGRPDLVVLSAESDVAAVQLGDGAGGFSTPSFMAVENPMNATIGDVTADGLPDLLVCCTLPPTLIGAVTVYPGDGAGGFLPGQDWPVGPSIRSVAIGDLNADGIQDLVAGGAAQVGSVFLLLGDGSGGFLPPRWHAAGQGPGHVATTDLDGDGRVDVLALNHHVDFETGAITVLRNLGAPEPWTSLGKGLMGSQGIPMLVGHGSLQAGEAVSLTLHGAQPSSAAFLVIGFLPLFAPFKGGVLVPRPHLIVGGLGTDATGSLDLHADWPTGVPSALTVWYQLWIVDPGAVAGLAGSNGVTSVTP